MNKPTASVARDTRELLDFGYALFEDISRMQHEPDAPDRTVFLSVAMNYELWHSRLHATACEHAPHRLSDVDAPYRRACGRHKDILARVLGAGHARRSVLSCMADALLTQLTVLGGLQG